MATEARRKRVAEARSFITAINESAAEGSRAERSESDSWWQRRSASLGLPPLVFQGALLILITAALLGGYLLLKNLRNRPEQARAGDPVQQVSPTSAPSDKSSPPDPGASPPVNDKPGTTPSPIPSPSSNRQPSPPEPARLASLTLIPFAPRDASSSNTLQLDQKITQARLNLTFKDDDSNSYSVSLKTLAGDEVWQRAGLKAKSLASGKTLPVTIDSARLRQQDYIITLNGVSKSGRSETLADYYFRVQRVPSQ